jgi:Exo70 exocyst complex subunit
MRFCDELRIVGRISGSILLWCNDITNIIISSHCSGCIPRGLSADFERIFEEHKELCVVDPRLRDLLQKEVAGVFLPNYRRFYDKYSKIRFSKKHQTEYTKYSPYKIDELLNKLYVDAE